MAESTEAAQTLEGAADAYLAAVGPVVDHRARAELARFVSWYGAHRPLGGLTAHEVSQYQEVHGVNSTDLSERLLPIKAFLAHAKKAGWTESNLGVHMRVKKAPAGKKEGEGAVAVAVAESESVVESVEAVEVVEVVDVAVGQRSVMTSEGLAAAKTELARLIAQRVDHAAAVGLAMADKDFRENAPLDAARDAQAHHEARIRQLERQIHEAVVVTPETRGDRERAHVGSRIRLTNLVSQQSVEYTLVGQNEVDAATGKISVASPMGQAILGQRAGNEIEVAAPSGVIRFRIERVDW